MQWLGMRVENSFSWMKTAQVRTVCVSQGMIQSRRLLLCYNHDDTTPLKIKIKKTVLPSGVSRSFLLYHWDIASSTPTMLQPSVSGSPRKHNWPCSLDGNDVIFPFKLEEDWVNFIGEVKWVQNRTKCSNTMQLSAIQYTGKHYKTRYIEEGTLGIVLYIISVHSITK